MHERIAKQAPEQVLLHAKLLGEIGCELSNSEEDFVPLLDTTVERVLSPKQKWLTCNLLFVNSL